MITNLAEQLDTALRRFPDGAVLIANDPDGYPVSLRCEPRLEGRALVVDRPTWFAAVDGVAALLGHSHDEQGWKLQSVTSRGTLETRDGTLVFTPNTVTDNTGSPGQLIAMVRNGHRAATAYLRRRNLPRPAIPWDTIKAARAAVSGQK
ncbi:hypothetical protein [Nocardia huaxiensis]|uniref:hypothetical protein n=1 Tax=Nocardia huaxiensis TaxID=2755382 RepID=UPI001E3EC0A8|nr:hypothetical protein [Nocardia huaxiensis]UFS99216.1 hypothetical protein LPY97_15650 [Nocardia huaxiensis]